MTDKERMANAWEYKSRYFREDKTQNEMTLDYIERYGSITPLEALAAFGSMRLGARIWELRHAGYNITTDRADGETPYAIYRFAE